MPKADTLQLTANDLNRLLTILRNSTGPVTIAQLVDAFKQAAAS